MGSLTRSFVALGMIGAWCGLAPHASAQPSDPPESHDEEVARAAFEAGVESSARGEWEAAADHFAASMERVPRVAAAYNLVIAYGHLGRHAELASAVDRLRDLADAERHAGLLDEVERLRTAALRELGVIELMIEPAGAHVSVDGELVSRGLIYLRPGAHRVHVGAPGYDAREIEITALAGTHTALRASLDATPLPALPSEPAVPLLQRPSEPSPPAANLRGGTDEPRRVAATSLWIAGAITLVSGLSVGGAAWWAADRIAGADPSTQGFLSQTMRYREERAATLGLALATGLLAAAATLLWPWSGERDAAWWIALAGVIVVGAGSALLIRSPDRLGATRLTDPVRALGSLLVSAGAPLVAAPLGAWIDAEIGATTSAGAGLGVAGAF